MDDMHLKRIEIQGFKTFAKKSALNFLPPDASRAPLTAVVGPNGSGKSNLADAIRWVLGEQSVKLLRGKKSEDVIFSGSAGRARSGFAEVSLTLDNTDSSMPIEYNEVVMTRRLYRDGTSDYLLNDNKVRLADIQLLLAQANVGQRSYSVIGQGMIDHILVSSPEERKAFFDDATGVKPFQMKRHNALLKLKRTYENLADVHMLLKEIEPRLRSLKRQAKRLEEREEVENQLRDLELGYYGTLWWKLEDRLSGIRKQHIDVQAEISEKETSLKALEARVADFESKEDGESKEDEGLRAIQAQYREAQKTRRQLRDRAFQIEKNIELDKVRAQSKWSPLPLSNIIAEVTGISAEQEKIYTSLQSISSLDEVEALAESARTIFERTKKLSNRLERPAPETIKADPKLIEDLEKTKQDIITAESRVKDIESQIDSYVVQEKQVRHELIELQRELRAKQQQIHIHENRRNTLDIDLARLEERRTNLQREMREHLKDLEIITTQRPEDFIRTEDLYPQIQKLRYKIELIGGIDPEIIEEYKETQERYGFLNEQVQDLEEALKSTEKIIDELDDQIAKQSEQAFKKINTEFQRYFKMLFGGGSCQLVKLKKDPKAVDKTDEDAVDEQVQEDATIARDIMKKRLAEFEDRIVGIDIQATPPGKRLKALNLLSGGERALTSIALISAIMSVNPGPFVVLDEVDAALDEANTIRFAGILDELSRKSQFIIITHNRATMEQADVLYGVTMGEDGVSNLLSVKLEDVTAHGTARR